MRDKLSAPDEAAARMRGLRKAPQYVPAERRRWLPDGARLSGLALFRFRLDRLPPCPKTCHMGRDTENNRMRSVRPRRDPWALASASHRRQTRGLAERVRAWYAANADNPVLRRTEANIRRIVAANLRTAGLRRRSRHPAEHSIILA